MENNKVEIYYTIEEIEIANKMIEEKTKIEPFELKDKIGIDKKAIEIYYLEEIICCIENKELGTSSFIGHCHEDNFFSITYTVHNKEDFFGEFENVYCDDIDFKDINTIEKIKEYMINKFMEYNKRAKKERLI